MNEKREKTYDAVVIGAGHAGAEAAHALAVLGKKTLLLSLSLDAVAFMACNPNIGGTAKGHLVKEIDALGGIMGEAADAACLQVRMLNRGNGPAVHSLRAQVDKALYHRLIKRRLEKTENLDLVQGEAADLLFENGKVAGIQTVMGETVFCRAVVLATGVYLNANVITGEHNKPAGPNGFLRSEVLTGALLKCGLPLRRFKTGTPPRVLGKSVDKSKMEIQIGEFGIPKFSYSTEGDVRNDHVCYLTYTNENTHKIILDNLDRAPLYNGAIAGTGPRYCPSIEDKVVRFQDKERHQLFIEPEGAETDEMYVQGLSTSLPYDLQEAMLKTVTGLENAVITRYGYAIEYDCLDPLALLPSLAVKGYAGLYAAGQINGSSGYEEAAAQGLTAGVNAARYLNGEPPYVFQRDEAYIGVLIDDLVTKGTNEPYRMMTSRAEHRLHLRQDNADLRLTETGRALGLVGDAQYAAFLAKKEEIERLRTLAETVTVPADEVRALCGAAGEPVPAGGARGKELLKRSGVSAALLTEYCTIFKDARADALFYLETEWKYEGYLAKQRRAMKDAARMEKMPLPPETDYLNMEGLRIEARQKLDKIRPLTLAQAARISGVTPADVTVLLLALNRKKGAK